MFDPDLRAAATQLLQDLANRKMLLATAESCTGGLIAGLLTEIPGSSAVVERGFVTYSNEAKSEALGIDMTLIESHGAVSEEVARAMAAGALSHSHADVTVAVTGIAGPGGETPGKPVGLVHLATALRSGGVAHRACRFGDIGRTPVRIATVREALAMVTASLDR